MTLLVRETPPLRLGLEVSAIGGGAFRWGIDDYDASDVPNGLTFSTTMPGGFDQASCQLARRPAYDYPDLQEFETVTIRGVGGDIAWQGRLESVPRSSGQQQMGITPGMVGWQAHLDDNKSARMIYIDSSLTRWGGSSAGMKLQDVAAGVDDEDATTASDVHTGLPAVQTALTGTWGRSRQSKAWYDAGGIPIGALYYAWTRMSDDVDPVNVGWDWSAWLANDDMQTSATWSGNLRANGPGTGTLTASDDLKVFAMVHLGFGAAGGNGNTAGVQWTALSVMGRHGLTLRGATGNRPGAYGYYASDIVGHAVHTWAPRLATTRAGVSTIANTSFVIPNCVFSDPTTASAIIAEVCRYDVNDWWVDDGPTFNLASRAGHGRDWIARVGPAGLSEAGPQGSQITNSVIVRYRDVVGVTRAVGPPGSVVDTTNGSLVDNDPQNAATLAGLTRRAVLDMGIVSTAAGAVKIGQAFLAEQALVSTAGQASLVGHVQDPSGTSWPAWAVRAGDRISFVDAHDVTPRRVVKTSYSDSSKTCQIDLDAPPQGLDALLARFGGVIAPYGL